jgi:hypothetical protein
MPTFLSCHPAEVSYAVCTLHAVSMPTKSQIASIWTIEIAGGPILRASLAPSEASSRA